jgi:DinB superfamily
MHQSAADSENRVTESADHRAAPIAKILNRLRDGREGLVFRLEGLTEDEVVRAAFHPRLQQLMSLVDWLYFLAEHDDHHLALARSAITTSRPNDRERENK